MNLERCCQMPPLGVTTVSARLLLLSLKINLLWCSCSQIIAKNYPAWYSEIIYMYHKFYWFLLVFGPTQPQDQLNVGSNCLGRLFSPIYTTQVVPFCRDVPVSAWYPWYRYRADTVHPVQTDTTTNTHVHQVLPCSPNMSSAPEVENIASSA